MSARILFASVLLLAAAVVCPAQIMSSQGGYTQSGSFTGSATFSAPPPYAMQAVTGAPYSGEEVSENVKVLMDGTRITQKNPVRKVWRDAEGRTRFERPMGLGPIGQQPSAPIVVEITDPVAGYRYTLDTQNKVAHRQALPPPGTRPQVLGGVAGSSVTGGIVRSGQAPANGGGGGGAGRAGVLGGIIGAVPSAAPVAPAGQANAAPMRPHTSHERLGTQSIDGVVAEGTRMTTTYPVGMMGNDREFSVVHETWSSPDLKVLVLSKTNDPRNGESTYRIENLSRTPPDPSLFTVPPDYTVVDEAGPFTIQYKGQQ